MNPLDQLQDIHLPQAVSMWPPAYGWWLLALLIILTIGASVYFWLQRRQWLKAKKAALQQLKELDPESQQWPQDVNALLKRLCLSYLPHEDFARTHGKQWAQFLAQQLPAKRRDDFIQAFTPLSENLYQSQPATLNTVEVNQAIRQWIKNFKPKMKRQINKEAAHV
ncbi:DUF4381 domain-containing protein [Alteromonas sp. a30]|uniref:DUF4381 domain-containing protein n=1 Tax=Alteromonas sp. a30 TaxID=2730917 RepID=UPI0022803F29|nr:DUF4381 domain-containing protein [Alteromonas sp. a30]MCY7295869.1 DUF4381 domain-containing protein [Alteromonas sp. a30]